MTSSVTFMRWDNLFDDLESQLESEIGAVEREVHDDIERERQAQLTLHDRLANLLGSMPATDVLSLTLLTGQTLSVSLIRLGQDWCAVDVISPTVLAGHALLPLAAISSLIPTEYQLVASLGRLPEIPATEMEDLAGPAILATPALAATRLARTMTLGFVLRDLARRRRTVEIHSFSCHFVGTLDRVGVDHCDLAEHAPEDARRSASVRGYRAVALASVALIRIL